ncbi:MAG: glycosyltransferase family 1 protein, partial [Candidatus Sumerlaeota bacterium]|nr:glycosyltransferase family 1 protein [Candidatus Sumerlaeota bacterium]
MRIGIDASSILPPRAGIGAYARGLLEALTRLAPAHQFVVFLNSLTRPQPREPFYERPNVTVRRWRLPGALLWRAWRHLNFPPVDWLTGAVDVFHTPGTAIPPQSHGACVVTIQDLYFIKHPEQCDALGGQCLLATLARRLPAIDRIITPSETVRRELLACYDVAPERVRAIPLGVDVQRFAPIDDPARLNAVRAKYGLPADFLLTVATLEPRKNLDGLLRAYARLKQSMGRAPALVLAGAAGWKSESIEETLRDSGLRGRRGGVSAGRVDDVDDVFFPGYVADEDLPALYGAARLFVLPSHDEGFGLPVLEAMACGTPVLTSQAPALEEVGGEASERA